MEVVQFLLLGLGIGAIYSLLGQGLVLIYRGSGIVNFAQGSFVMVGGYAYYEFRVSAAWPAIPSVVAATAVGALLGVAVQFLILRPMRTSSPIERVIATLGVLLTLQAAAVLRYGCERHQRALLPADRRRGAAARRGPGVDRLIILLIGAVLTATLYAVFRWTSFGPGGQRHVGEPAGGREPGDIRRTASPPPTGPSRPASRPWPAHSSARSPSCSPRSSRCW